MVCASRCARLSLVEQVRIADGTPDHGTIHADDHWWSQTISTALEIQAGSASQMRTKGTVVTITPTDSVTIHSLATPRWLSTQPMNKRPRPIMSAEVTVPVALVNVYLYDSPVMRPLERTMSTTSLLTLQQRPFSA